MMSSSASTGEVGHVDARPSLASARKASEEAKYDRDDLILVFSFLFIFCFFFFFFFELWTLPFVLCFLLFSSFPPFVPFILWV